MGGEPADADGGAARDTEAKGRGSDGDPRQPVRRADREQDDRRDEQRDDDEPEPDAAEHRGDEDQEEDEPGCP